MRMTREDWRHLGLIVLVWGAAGFLFGMVASEVIFAFATPTVPTAEHVLQQLEPTQPPDAD